jgi:hypothetical protein
MLLTKGRRASVHKFRPNQLKNYINSSFYMSWSARTVLTMGAIYRNGFSNWTVLKIFDSKTEQTVLATESAIPKTEHIWSVSKTKLLAGQLQELNYFHRSKLLRRTVRTVLQIGTIAELAHFYYWLHKQCYLSIGIPWRAGDIIGFSIICTTIHTYFSLHWNLYRRSSSDLLRITSGQIQ